MKTLFAIIPFIPAMVISAAAIATEREITDLEHQIGQAILKADTAFVERVFADDFFYTGVRGETKTKRDLLAEIKSSAIKFEQLEFDDIKIRLFGDTAVATGLATTKGRTPQGEVTGRVRYTRVYVKRSSGWQLVVFQGTPVLNPEP